MMNKPKDAWPTPKARLTTICPRDKYERKANLTTHELCEFDSVCQKGGNQIIACYGDITDQDEEFCVYDFYNMCSNCKYLDRYSDITVIGNRKVRSSKWHNSYTSPYYIQFEFREYIADYFDEYISKSYVYLISDGEYIKIGKADNPLKRLSDLQVANARPLEIVCIIPCKNNHSASALESELHKIYKKYRKVGEWFDIRNLIDIELFRTQYPVSDYISQSEDRQCVRKF